MKTALCMGPACCSVLQCVAVCCSVSQCVSRAHQGAAPSSSLRGVLQRVAAWCRVVQHGAACCSVLQRVAAC